MPNINDRFEVSISLNVRTVEGDAYFSSNVTYASADYPTMVGIEMEMVALLARLSALGEAKAKVLMAEVR